MEPTPSLPLHGAEGHLKRFDFLIPDCRERHGVNVPLHFFDDLVRDYKTFGAGKSAVRVCPGLRDSPGDRNRCPRDRALVSRHGPIEKDAPVFGDSRADRGDVADLLGGCLTLLGEFADFSSHDREPLSVGAMRAASMAALRASRFV